MENETNISESLPFAALTVEQASRLIRGVITIELDNRRAVEPPSPRNEVMNLSAAVAFLGECGYPIRKGYLYNLVAANAIPHGKIGKRLIFRRTELAEWIIARTTPANEKRGAENALLIAKTALRQMRRGGPR